MKKNIIKIILGMIVLVPIVVSAQIVPPIQTGVCQPYTLICLAGIIVNYLKVAIYLIIGLAVVTFIWNIYKYFFRESEKTEAGKYVMYSTIGFFVMLSFWGLVAILSNSLQLPNTTPAWPFSGNRAVNSINNNQLNPGNTIPDTTTR